MSDPPAQNARPSSDDMGRQPITIDVEATQVTEIPPPPEAVDSAFSAAIEPEPAPPPVDLELPEPVPPPPSPRSPSKWPMLTAVFGGAGLALLGALLLHANDDSAAAITTLRHDLELASVQLDGRLKAVDSRVQTGLDGQAKALEGQRTALATLEKRLKEAEARLESPVLPAAPVPAPVAALPDALADLSTANVQISALDERMTGLTGRVTQVEAVLAAPKLSDQVVQSKIEVPKTPPDLAAQLVIGQRIVAAVQNGTPFPAEFAALQTQGVDEARLAPLQRFASKGAPADAALAIGLKSLAPAIAAAVAPPPAKDQSLLDKLAAGAAGLVKVRRAGEAGEGDVGGRLAAIDALIAKGNLPEALATWANLPAPAQAASKDWADILKERVAATDAARTLVADAITGLGAKK